MWWWAAPLAVAALLGLAALRLSVLLGSTDAAEGGEAGATEVTVRSETPSSASSTSPPTWSPLATTAPNEPFLASAVAAAPLSSAQAVLHSAHTDAAKPCAVPSSLAYDPNIANPDVDYGTCFENCLFRNQPRPGVVQQCSSSSTSQSCHGGYPPQVIKEVCTRICENQFPANCSSSSTTFVIVGGSENNQGFGSMILARLGHLVFALSSRRTMLVDAQTDWTYESDPFPRCRARHPDCYYVSTSNCQIPDQYETRPDFLTIMHLPAENITAFELFKYVNTTKYRYLRVKRGTTAIGKYLGIIAGRPAVSSRFPSLKDKKSAWWGIQIACFMFRPNLYMLRTAILPLVEMTFGMDNLFPARFMSVFMRGGDKWKEATLVGPEVYFKAIQAKSREFNITHVYLNSDSAEFINGTQALIRQWDPSIAVYFIPYQRLPKGMRLEDLGAVRGTPAVRLLVNVMLADLFIVARAHYWIGFGSSYYAQLQDAIRLGHGGYGSDYHSVG